MKYILILTLLILGCGADDKGDSKQTAKQVYYDCYKVSKNMFKRIPKKDYKDLNVDDLCDEDTSFHEEELDKACNKACRDAYDHFNPF